MRTILAMLAAGLFATSAMAAPDKTGQDKPSGPQGPGQHGQPGQEGNSGPLIEDGPQWLKGYVLATHTGDHESPTDRDSGGGNDPNSKAPGQTQNPNPSK